MAVTKQTGVNGKVCSSCRTWKPLSDFYADASHGKSQGGKHCRCKICYLAGRKRLEL